MVHAVDVGSGVPARGIPATGLQSCVWHIRQVKPKGILVVMAVSALGALLSKTGVEVANITLWL